MRPKLTKRAHPAKAFNLPRLASDEAKHYASAQGADLLGKAMIDIQGRIPQMDEAGVEMQLLSFTSPGPQGETDPAKAAALGTSGGSSNALKRQRARPTTGSPSRSPRRRHALPPWPRSRCTTPRRPASSCAAA